MRLVLHIGMPKAGSSALQASLHAANRLLRRHGLLYPAGGGLPKNHNMLVCSFADPARLPRLLRQAYGGDPRRIEAAFEGFMHALEAAVARRRPATLLLSGEMLFRNLGGGKGRLETALARLSDAITVVAYVRSPAQYYLSLVQQTLKASSQIGRPRPVRYRGVLESYARISADVRVIAYERAALHGADITRDFLHRLAPDLAAALPAAAIKQSNTTLSAEGIDLLHRYRSLNHPGDDGVFTPDTGALLKALRTLEEKVPGFRRPALHDAVRDYINGASPDVHWLRDRHGIVFADVDYAATMEAPRPPAPAALAEICAVDAARRDRMLAAALHPHGIPAAEGAAHDNAWRDRTLAAIHDRLTARPAPRMRFRAAFAGAEP